MPCVHSLNGEPVSFGTQGISLFCFKEIFVMKLEKISGIELAFYKKSGKEAVTTSRVLADGFGKRHDTVLRKINDLKKRSPEVFTDLKIAVSKYIDSSGKSNKEYILSRDAYMWFGMSFTGQKADKFRMDLIQAFNQMESWITERIKNSLEYKVMSDTLTEVRLLQGKETKGHHYSNEARLINWAMTGKFRPVDRELLSDSDLDLLFALQKRNTVLIGCGMAYADRKESLGLFTEIYKSKGNTLLSQLR